MIKKAKDRLAQEQILEFLDKMQKLGFNQKEVMSIIKEMIEEGKK